MRLTANILTGLATLLYLVPFQFVVATAKPGWNDGEVLWSGLFVLVPLWLFLIVALVLATARGNLEWLPLRRGWQHTLIVAIGLALFAMTLFAFLGRLELASELPLLACPFTAWGDLALPPITIAFLFFSLNASLGALVPAVAYRAPFATIAAVALAHGVGLLGTW